MLALLFPLLLACTGTGAKPAKDQPAPKPKVPMIEVPSAITPPPAATAQPTVNLAASASLAWRALDHLAEGTFAFPSGETVPGIDGRFSLSGPWSDEGARKGGLHSYSTPLPFSTSMPRPNYAPRGARFVHKGKDVPFNTTIAAPSKNPIATWYVDHGRIVVLSADNPSEWAEPAVMIVDELALDVKKRSFSASGLSASAFALQTHQSERVERPALFLPAPSTASFPVPVPEGAKLRFGVGMLDDPLTGKPAGEGAKLTVKLDGTEVWSGTIPADDNHVEVGVELTGAAGKTGALSFETTGGNSAVAVTNPVIVQPTTVAPRRVIVIGIDTLRRDALGTNGYARDTSPELDQWLSQSVQFDQAYAPAPRTKPSFRTAFTGLMPSHANGATTLAERLNTLGFATGGVVGNVHLVPRFGFSRGMDHWEYENGARGSDQVDRALAWLKSHEKEDSFLFVHFMDPHTFYNAPDEWTNKYSKRADRPKVLGAKFDRWQVINLDKKRKLTDADKEWIRGQYDAEVAYTTHQVSRLLAAVETMAGPTLTILHTDHGEEFWDHRGFEHNHSLYNELVHVELAIRPPGGWQGATRVNDPVSLADIVPTVLDFVGAEPMPTDGLSLRSYVDAAATAQLDATKAAATARPLSLGHMRYERDRWGTVYQGKKYILHTSAGREELYDLVADPAEKTDLSRTAEPALMATMRQALAKSTTWPVQKGLRLRIPAGVETTTITFDEPIFAAGIMDPQWNARVRANVEWGERPPVSLADVGTVALSTDRKVVTYVPGPNPLGQAFYLQCEADPCPDGELVMGKKRVRISKSDNLAGGTRYSIEAGYVMAPDDRSEFPEVSGDVSHSDTQALEALGYLQKDED